jgi:hypothetical protein
MRRRSWWTATSTATLSPATFPCSGPGTATQRPRCMTRQSASSSKAGSTSGVRGTGGGPAPIRPGASTAHKRSPASPASRTWWLRWWRRGARADPPGRRRRTSLPTGGARHTPSYGPFARRWNTTGPMSRASARPSSREWRSNRPTQGPWSFTGTGTWKPFLPRTPATRRRRPTRQARSRCSARRPARTSFPTSCTSVAWTTAPTCRSSSAPPWATAWAFMVSAWNWWRAASWCPWSSRCGASSTSCWTRRRRLRPLPPRSVSLIVRHGSRPAPAAATAPPPAPPTPAGRCPRPPRWPPPPH